MENFHERLSWLMGKYGHNPNSLAARLGFTTPVVYNMLGGRKSKPSYEFLFRLKAEFPQTNLNWLVSNVGDPIARPSTQVIKLISECVKELENCDISRVTLKLKSIINGPLDKFDKKKV